jgi:hypothetical protein
MSFMHGLVLVGPVVSLAIVPAVYAAGDLLQQRRSRARASLRPMTLNRSPTSFTLFVGTLSRSMATTRVRSSMRLRRAPVEGDRCA